MANRHRSGSRPLRTFGVVRRSRWLDGFVEAAFGALLILAWVVVVVGGFAALLGLLLALGRSPDIGSFVLIGLLVLTSGLAFADSVDRRIRRVALQPGVNRGTLALGADGMRLTGLFLARFVPWARIDEVWVDERRHAVVVRLVGKGQIRFRVADPPKVKEALELARAEASERPRAGPVRALRDAREDLGGWLERAKGVFTGGYRAEVVTPETLLRVAEDPAAEPEQRIGAALALGDAPEPIRVRVRVAAECTARPHVGEAMTQALEGVVDERVLKKALVQQ